MLAEMNSKFRLYNKSSELADFNFSHRKSPSGQLLKLSTSIKMTSLNKYYLAWWFDIEMMNCIYLF